VGRASHPVRRSTCEAPPQGIAFIQALLPGVGVGQVAPPKREFIANGAGGEGLRPGWRHAEQSPLVGALSVDEQRLVEPVNPECDGHRRRRFPAGRMGMRVDQDVRARLHREELRVVAQARPAGLAKVFGSKHWRRLLIGQREPPVGCDVEGGLDGDEPPVHAVLVSGPVSLSSVGRLVLQGPHRASVGSPRRARQCWPCACNCLAFPAASSAYGGRASWPTCQPTAA